MILAMVVALFVLTWLAVNVAVSGKVMTEYMRHGFDKRVPR
jgi:hypothetical protein